MADLVVAAGGIVTATGADGSAVVAVVHRPRRQDWSFPKGKVEPEESLIACALREVFEETGLHCRVRDFVGVAEYEDCKGRSKVVAYWAMDVLEGSFAPNDEVDELRWVDPGTAERLLTYERDRELLRGLGLSAAGCRAS